MTPDGVYSRITIEMLKRVLILFTITYNGKLSGFLGMILIWIRLGRRFKLIRKPDKVLIHHLSHSYAVPILH